MSLDEVFEKKDDIGTAVKERTRRLDENLRL